MVAVPLIHGHLEAGHYNDDFALADNRIDELRAKASLSILRGLLPTDALPSQIFCVEDPVFSAEYLDPSKRAIGNALTITLNDGTVLDEVRSSFPLCQLVISRDSPRLYYRSTSTSPSVTPVVVKRVPPSSTPSLSATSPLTSRLSTSKSTSLPFPPFLSFFY